MTTFVSARLRIGALLAGAVALAGCAPAADTAVGDAAVTRVNCGIDIGVDAPPQRIYAAYQPSIEIAHALGVTDRLVGTAFLDAAVLPEYRDAQASVPYVEKLPSRDELLSQRPDFVLSGYNGVFAKSAQASVGTRASLHELGVRTWVLSPLCPSADGLADEAIDPATVRFDNVYADLRDLGALWGVPERAEQVATDLRERIEAVRATVAGAERPRVAVVTPKDDGSYTVAGGIDFVTRIIEAAGGVNAFADLTARRNVPIGAEEIIARDPDIILTSLCCEAGYIRADGQSQADIITGNPAFANLTAVRAGAVHPFLFADRAAGVRIAHATELVAELIHPDLFGR
ncbi:ABC transporter substrate-binding protein [Nocardia otitidiscaviarum]|uniref:ABC transporter substrate-binding protein n=1 Tax=Nocardia otitidiscaviarum TaxID=1823 RepID=UPI0018938D2C|nr:ABC transporter substrate-binding protein [Nocardia otitidiscaviarum]MBF6136915.1 ABC transporter substrate-binding protein [Nocardia otitidiscaviarum]